MKCPSCEVEMYEGYSLVLGLYGKLHIKAEPVEEGVPSPNVCICPNCGTVKLYVDTNTFKPKLANLAALSASADAVKRWIKGYNSPQEKENKP